MRRRRETVSMARKKYRPHTRVSRRHFPWRFLMTVALITILLMVHLWQKQNIKYRLKNIEHLKKQIVEIQDENKRLRAKVTQLTSAGWIEKVARQNLGLSDPEHEPIVVTYWPVYERTASLASKKMPKEENAEKIAELLSK
jgi:cell division protein FtsL